MLSNLRRLFRQNSRLVRNTLGTALLKGGAVILSLASTPAYLRFFEDKGALGVWFTILSVLNWLLLFDFGVGNGLRNSLVKALAHDDVKLSKQLVSAGYLFAFSVALVVASLSWNLVGIIDWFEAFGVSDTGLASDDLVLSIRIVLVGVLMQVVLRNAVSILYALERVAVGSALALFGTVATLVFLLLGRTGDVRTDLINLSYVQALSATIPLIAATVYVFCVFLPGRGPDPRYVTWAALRQVAGLGMGFFIVQIALLVINSTDQLLIATIYGGPAVVEHQVHLRVYSLFGLGFQILAQPVWSAVGVKFAQGRLSWIRRVRKWLLYLAAIASILAFILSFGLQWVLDVWLGIYSLPVHPQAAFIFAALATVEMFVFASTAIANGMGKLRLQVFLTPLGALLKFPLVLLLSQFIDLWASVVLAHALCLLPLAVFQPISLTRHLR